MADNQPLVDRTKRAQDLLVGFDEYCRNHTKVKGGRYQVKAERVLSHLADYRGLFETLDDYAAAPASVLQSLDIEDAFSLPAGSYPALKIENCNFRNGLEISEVTIHGPLQILNNNDSTSTNTVITLTDAIIEGPVSILNYNFLSLLIHASHTHGLDIERCEISRIRVDRKTVIDGNVIVNGSKDVGIFDTEIKGAFTYIPHGATSDIEMHTCIYGDKAIFENSTDIQFIGITDTDFLGGIHFKCKVADEFHFENVRIHWPADFQNAVFAGPTYFDGSEFHCAPEFYGATLFPDTNFMSARFLAFDGEREHAAYRWLRHISHDMLKSSLDEGRFFAYEQRSLANATLRNNRLSFSAWLSKLYDWISEYGQSTVKPFWWLFGSWLFFSFLYWHAEMAYQAIKPAANAAGWATSISAWLGFSLQNLINPLGLFSRTVQFEAQTWWVAGLGIVESLFSTAIAALWFLAVRRRFRKGSE